MSEHFGAGPPRPEGRVAPLNERSRPGAEAATFEKNSHNSNSNRPGFNRSLAGAQALAEQRLRRRRQIEAIHRLGPRVTFELFDELDRHHGLGEDLDRRLERYAAVDPATLRSLGGDRFPTSPVRIVRDTP